MRDQQTNVLPPDDEGRKVQQASLLIEQSNAKAAGEYIKEHQLTSGDDQVIFLAAAACNVNVLSHLIHDTGLDADARTRLGETVVYDLTFFANRSEPEIDRPCRGDAIAEGLTLLLKAGADPCAAPTGEPESKPAMKAAEWGNSTKIVEILSPYASSCST